MKQTTAVSHIRKLLMERRIDLAPRRLQLADGRQWPVFERHGRQVGVDAASGLWLRESAEEDWHLLDRAITTSGALMAVEFLSKD